MCIETIPFNLPYLKKIIVALFNNSTHAYKKYTYSCIHTPHTHMYITKKNFLKKKLDNAVSRSYLIVTQQLTVLRNNVITIYPFF
jgi:hypothetical protein